MLVFNKYRLVVLNVKPNSRQKVYIPRDSVVIPNHQSSYMSATAVVNKTMNPRQVSMPYIDSHSGFGDSYSVIIDKKLHMELTTESR